MANYSILVKLILEKANIQGELDKVQASIKSKPISIGVDVDTMTAEKSLASLQARMQKIKQETGATAIEYKINTQIAEGQEQITGATLRYTDALGMARTQTLGLAKDEEGVVQWIEKGNTYTENSLKVEKDKQKQIEAGAKASIGYSNELEKRNATIATTNMNLERMAATSAKAFATPQVQASVNALKSLEAGYRNGTVSQAEYNQATKRLNTDLAIQKDALNTVNKQGMGFVSMLELAAKKILIWGIGTGIIYGALRNIKDGIQYIKDLNKEMTNIQLVTGQTADQMSRLAQEFNNVATELGVTTLAVAKGSLEWQRAGYNVEDTAKLLKASMMQASLGNMDAAQSTDRLISTLKGFQLTANDAMSVIDKLVQLDNNYASSVNEISTALSYSSSVAKEAGITFDELSSYITVTSSITRASAETIGTAYKTLITRFTQVKAGASVDDLGESLNNVEKVLGKVGIQLRDSADSFRPLGNVIDEIAKKWDGFSEIQKAQIATAVAGTRQQNIFMTLMQNYDQVLKAQTLEANAAGLAQQRYAIYLDSVEAATNRQTAAWQKLVATTANSQLIIWFINLNTSILTATTKMGGFIPLIGFVVSTLLLLQGPAVIGAFRSLISQITAAIVGFKALGLAAMFTGEAITASLGLFGILASVAFMAFSAIKAESERAAENVKQLSGEIDSLNQSMSAIKNTTKSLNDLWSEYEILKNKTIRTNEEQQRFIDIQNQIKTLIPEVSGTYDAQGNFILGISEKLKTYIDLLEKQYDIELKLKNLKTEEGFKSKIDIYGDSLKTLQNDTKMLRYNESLADKPEVKFGIFLGNEDAYKKTVEKFKYSVQEGQLSLQKSFLDIQKDFNSFDSSQKVFFIKDLQSRGDWGNALANQLQGVTQYVDVVMSAYLRDNPVQKILDAPVQGKTKGEIEKLTKSLEDAMSALSGLDDQMNTLIKNYKEYGIVGIEEVEQLKKAFGEDYVKALTVENGQLKLNVEVVRELTMAKYEFAVVQAENLYFATRETEGMSDHVMKLHEELVAIRLLRDEYKNNVDIVKVTAEEKKKAYQDLLKIVMDMIKQQKEAEKQALQDSLKDYKDSIDARKQALQDQAESEKQALQDQLDGYKKIIDAEKDLLDQKQKNRDFQDELESKNKGISDIDAQLLALQFDNSEAANAKRLELEAQRAEKVKELNKFTADKGTEDAKTALDKEYQNFEEQNKRKQTLIERNFEAAQKALDADYKAFEKNIDDKIKVIDAYLRETGTMTADAMQIMKQRTNEFYNSLLEWNRKFGSSVQTDIIEMLQKAFDIKVKLGQGGTEVEGSDRKRDYTFDPTTQGYRNKYSGKIITKEEYEKLSYHKGGVVGNEMPKLPGSEVMARLLKGEQVSTDSMLSNFMMRTLPQIVANVGGKSGDIKIDMPITIQGNATEAVVASFKTAVYEAVNVALKDRGTRRNAFSYSN